MGDFNPGPGWREVEYAPHDGEAEYLTWTPVNDDSDIHYWVREVPVPPLPTVLYTVIRAVSKMHSNSQWIMTLTEDGWEAAGSDEGGVNTDWMRKYVGNFEILSEPRVVTAKAVLDRVMVTGISGPVVDELYREFGVEL